MEIANVSLLLAFAAGFASILSPCVLPLVPVYFAYLTGASASDVRNGRSQAAFFHSIAFCGGFSLVLILLGISVGLAGYLLRDNLQVISKGAGVFMILMGLHVARVIRIPGLDRQYTADLGSRDKVGYARSFGIGAAYSLGWSPCIGPTLGAILTLAAASSTVSQGGLLLAVYALGFSLPFLVAALAISHLRGVMQKIMPHLGAVEMVSGVVLVVVGILVFQGSLVELNRYFGGFSPTVPI